MQVAASERGLVRLFAVDLPPEAIPAFRTPVTDDAGELINWPLRDALGATHLEPDQIELFDVADLDDLGLFGYMEQGLGIPQKDVDEDRLRLASFKGYVLVVLSAAFGGEKQTLAPRHPLRWLGTYVEEGMRVRYEPLPTQSATGSTAPTQPGGQPAPRSPYITLLLALLALPVLALILGALFFWWLS